MVGSKRYRILIFCAALILVNAAAQFIYTRIDFTADKRYTLTAKTKAILKNSEKDIVITVFLDGELPAPFRRLKNATQDLISDYRSFSGSNIQVVFEDPLEGASAEQRDTIIYQLQSVGIEPTAVNIKTDEGFSQKLVFPMAMVESDGKQMPVKLLQNQEAGGNYEEHINNSIRNLEYSLTSAIRKVQTGENPRVGFTEGHGEPADTYLNDAMRAIGASYEVGRVNLQQITKEGLDKLNLLIIAKPQVPFTETEKYKLNYFIMHGGRVVWSIDQVSAELDSLGQRSRQLAINKELNLDDMLFQYGARVNYNLIADANCAEIPISMGGEQGQMELAPWPYFPLLIPNDTHSLVKNIDAVRSEFASTVDTIANRGVKKQVILYSSPYNIVYSTPKMFTLQMVADKPDPNAFTGVPQITGVLLEGNFQSVFLNRPIPEGITENYSVPEKSAANQMIVIGDGDIFKNQVSSRDGSAFPLGYDRYSQKNFGNKALLLNIVDYMTSKENLIDLRNKQIMVRLLDKTVLRTEKTYWQVFNICAPLILLITFGIFQHYYRRYKYAK